VVEEVGDPILEQVTITTPGALGSLPTYHKALKAGVTLNFSNQLGEVLLNGVVKAQAFHKEVLAALGKIKVSIRVGKVVHGKVKIKDKTKAGDLGRILT